MKYTRRILCLLVLVLVAFVLLTWAAPATIGRLRRDVLWVAAVVCLAMAALVKFVPAATAAIVSLVWIRYAPTPMRRLRRGDDHPALFSRGVLQPPGEHSALRRRRPIP